MINLNRLLISIAFSFSLLSLLMIVNIFNILSEYLIYDSINCQFWGCNTYSEIYKVLFFPSNYHKAHLKDDSNLELPELLKIFLTTAAATTAGFQLLVTRDEKLRNQLSEAITLLDSDRITIRIQGILLLKNISPISEGDTQLVIELLTSFIRVESPLIDNINSDSTNITPDIQTALSELFKIKSENLEKDLSYSNLKKARFYDYDLRGINFTNSNLSGAFFRKANLSQVNFVSSHLESVNFSETTLDGANFEDAHLDNANFNCNNLKGVKFKHAYLRGAKFEKTVFDEKVIFDDAILDVAKFINATLKKASFKSSVLEKVMFSGADLEDANFEDANFKDADLRGAKNIIPEQIKKAKNWELAKYDSEFRKQLGLSSEEK